MSAPSAQLAPQKCQINFKLSATYHKKAFLMGNTESLVDLVWLLQRGGFGLTKDPFKAFEWLNKADFVKNTECTFRLAQCMRRGLGTDKDAAGSRAFFRLAAENGHAGAMHELGDMFATGEGGEANLDFAEELWDAASAASGAPPSKTHLSDKYAAAVASSEISPLSPWARLFSSFQTP